MSGECLEGDSRVTARWMGPKSFSTEKESSQGKHCEAFGALIGLTVCSAGDALSLPGYPLWSDCECEMAASVWSRPTCNDTCYPEGIPHRRWTAGQPLTPTDGAGTMDTRLEVDGQYIVGSNHDDSNIVKQD